MTALTDIAALKTRIAALLTRWTTIEKKDDAQSGQRITLRNEVDTLKAQVAALLVEPPPATKQYQSSLSGLQGGATYHVRAYATSQAGTGYGNEVDFATPGPPPPSPPPPSPPPPSPPPTGVFNVKDYGAKGDGVADDVAAILAAIAAAKGATVYLPAGTYRLSKTLVVPPGTHLVGEAVD